jgi:hypothetical protein
MDYAMGITLIVFAGLYPSVTVNDHQRIEILLSALG